MDINKANEITKLVNKTDKSIEFLKSLDGRGYNNEFTIYYRGVETCELEESALNVLIEYYKKELKEAEEKLKSI